jgi:hypothetical protein
VGPLLELPKREPAPDPLIEKYFTGKLISRFSGEALLLWGRLSNASSVTKVIPTHKPPQLIGRDHERVPSMFETLRARSRISKVSGASANFQC